MSNHLNAVSMAEHQRVLKMAKEFADRAETAEAEVEQMDPNAYIVASLDWQDRALAAEAEVERLTSALAERERRIAAALEMHERGAGAGGEFCLRCLKAWPCADAKALRGGS